MSREGFCELTHLVSPEGAVLIRKAHERQDMRERWRRNAVAQLQEANRQESYGAKQESIAKALKFAELLGDSP